MIVGEWLAHALTDLRQRNEDSKMNHSQSATVRRTREAHRGFRHAAGP